MKANCLARLALDVPELLDTVLENLKNDKSSLRACSLVSSLWRDTSQPYFFATVVVKGDYVGFEYADFLHFIEEATRVRSYIRTLVLTRGKANLGVLDSHTPRLYLSMLQTVVKSLHRLEKLKLVDLFLIKDKDYKLDLEACNRTISCLHFESLYVPTFSFEMAECMEVIQLFKVIDDLRLVKTGTMIADGVISHRCRLTPISDGVHVKKVTLVKMGGLVTPRTLTKMIAIPYLHTLSLPNVRLFEIEELQPFLQEVKPHLRNIYANLCDLDDRVTRRGGILPRLRNLLIPMDLSPCTFLQTIHLTIGNRNHFDGSYHAYSNVSQAQWHTVIILLTGAPPTLKRVTISLSREPAQYLDWLQLVHTLRSDKFTSLDEVRIRGIQLNDVEPTTDLPVTQDTAPTYSQISLSDQDMILGKLEGILRRFIISFPGADED